MKISGDMIGNDGDRMGNTQRFTKFFLGLLFSRSGVKQKETWIFQGQYKNKKKTLSCLLSFPKQNDLNVFVYFAVG